MTKVNEIVQDDGSRDIRIVSRFVDLKMVESVYVDLETSDVTMSMLSGKTIAVKDDLNLLVRDVEKVKSGFKGFEDAIKELQRRGI